jgi:hypothetical protein
MCKQCDPLAIGVLEYNGDQTASVRTNRDLSLHGCIVAGGTASDSGEPVSRSGGEDRWTAKGGSATNSVCKSERCLSECLFIVLSALGSVLVQTFDMTDSR